MKSTLITIVVLSYLSVLCVSHDFDFFFFVEQWPGSYCEEHGCCKPSTGVTPSDDFTIIGLWPKFNNGSTPSNCNPNNVFDPTKISDLIKSMEEEWTRIEPNGKFYEVEKIKEAIKNEVGYTPGLSCHKNTDGESMLYQVYLCVDSSASNFIECPIFPKGKACVSQALFPSFQAITTTASGIYYSK
ncbi:hypothetical protein CsatB_027688 [Cannabis sativa]